MVLAKWQINIGHGVGIKLRHVELHKSLISCHELIDVNGIARVVGYESVRRLTVQ